MHFALVGTHTMPDILGLVPAATRSGRSEELLRGPFLYGIVHAVLAATLWRRPESILAIAVLCGGDGLAEVEKAYDVILFEAPLATDQTQTKDPNRFDLEGKLLKEVLTALPSHLKIGGRMYLMSHPDLSPYLPANGFQWKVLRNFTADATEKNLAILEVWRA